MVTTNVRSDPARSRVPRIVSPRWIDGSCSATGGVNGRTPNDEIYVANFDGTGLIGLTSGAGTTYYPAWSPDGKRIVFISDRTGFEQVYTIGRERHEPDRAHAGPVRHDQVPDWSPDGSKIAYEDECTGTATST